ncbi:MAG: response regulator [Prochloron sp. SP5CPC1]|nr:response regulator [Candidatus Paraprochloron terpiosi SP5CPC1]
MNTVLIVEDGLADLATSKSYLQQAGFRVIEATSVEQAKEKLTQMKPDAILLDIMLPGQSGFELCKDLKDEPETKTIPVILCSNKNTDVDKMWGEMLGADAYLTKPVNREELITTVQKLANV